MPLSTDHTDVALPEASTPEVTTSRRLPLADALASLHLIIVSDCHTVASQTEPPRLAAGLDEDVPSPDPNTVTLDVLDLAELTDTRVRTGWKKVMLERMYVSNCNVSMLKFSHCCWENSVESCKAAANKELFTSVPSVGRNDPIALHTRPLDVELRINDPLISGASAVHAFVRLATILPAVITADFDPINKFPC